MGKRPICTMFKVNRSVMAKLMPFIKEIRCVMNPLDNGVSTGAREIFRTLNSTSNKEASPDTKVLPIFVNKSMWPRVEVTYVNDHIERWYTHKLAPTEVMSEIFLHARFAQNDKLGITSTWDVTAIDLQAEADKAVAEYDEKKVLEKKEKLGIE